jgi:heme-degrading monooxygenase HmoA
MILEIGQIAVKPGMESAFEAAVAEAVPIFRRSKGCLSMRVTRSIEVEGRYRILVEWETLENHTVDFRGSENFTQWRALVSPFFAEPPAVEHATVPVVGF